MPTNELGNIELAGDLYLDLLKQTLCGSLVPEQSRPAHMVPSLRGNPVTRGVFSVVRKLLNAFDLDLCAPYRPELRAEGRDWPTSGLTMIGMARLQNLQDCVTDVIRNRIPGDLIETGIWRGGACIFMRAILKLYGEENRTVWAADSFEGLPKSDGRYEQDLSDPHWRYADALAVSLEEVKASFQRFGLLDGQVKFLKGWFKDTLPSAPIHQLAVLRLDGDMYSSTMDALESLYPKLAPDGYVIIDDYGAVECCSQAVEDYRKRHAITEEMKQIDWSGVVWQKHDREWDAAKA